MKKIILSLLIISITSCTSSSDFEKGKAILENQGYTEVENTGYDAFCCSGDSDSFSTGFRATGKHGEEIKGCICSGFMKGITIRYE